MTKHAVIALAALLAAAVIAGCGGGAEESSAPSAEPHAIVPSHQPSEPTGSASAPAEGPLTDPGRLPNEGSKAVAPGVPLSKGGDDSIQTFGVEAPREDRLQATTNAKAYLDARVVGNWSEACARLWGVARAQFGKLTEDGSCEGTQETLTTGVQAEKLRIAADIDVISMRAVRDRGFLIYRNGEGTPSAMSIHREPSGEWKVGVLDGSALVL